MKESRKVKKSGKTRKAQESFLENRSTQGELWENFYTSFKINDTITMFGSSFDHI